MKHDDVAIGTRFETGTGQRWCCTDVGRRTLTAIELVPDVDPAWYRGPPYPVPEVVFDELDIANAFLSGEDAIEAALAHADEDPHPGYPGEAVMAMMRTRLLEEAQAYPRPRLLRIDRVDATGEPLHPYAALPKPSGWCILLYTPFTDTFSALPERAFVQLRPATRPDWEARKRAMSVGAASQEG
ncbi:hypothetical protein [Lysobacter capsici]|uniref:hypothetical protein n=1 Tax=Lysobacter capsici TaxID=435897 RepID=UPI00287B8B5B|nr:hypothetical protein [Lysobacter capsici]WND81128.1 hypothetical protein RJ610_01750 [Lysobacter capsici]WND86324.1 hypothetical protein RJ609_01750 [Lysobacter capsici]